MQRRIVCAAMRCLDGTLIVGPRHFDSVMRKQYEHLGLLGIVAPKAVPPEQGFIDQFGTYLSRTEAWRVAESAGQIITRVGGDTTDGGTLYSENLY